MKKYQEITSRYLASHKKNTRLTLISVIIAVALVTTIFSMLDVFWQFEKQQVINDYGSYHIIIKNIGDNDAKAVNSRVDVDAAEKFIEFSGAQINGRPVDIVNYECAYLATSSSFKIVEGTMPKTKNGIVVEEWAAGSNQWQVGDPLKITGEDGNIQAFTITGICTDFSKTKADGIPGLFVSYEGAKSIAPSTGTCLIVRFKDHVNVNNAEKSIEEQIGVNADQIGHNERLLALMGQSVNSTILGLYGTGFVLFLLVLVAGVTMIYNTFNISVMERIHQFGLLRCIGASKKQIKKLVRKEGQIITIRALPIGIAIGILVTFLCSAILKYFNSSIFSDIPLFHISIIGMVAGALVGIMTVFLASLAPAKKASRVSPINAVTGGDHPEPKKEKMGLLTRVFHVETAMGIHNATAKKKTLVLMATSIAISIILFLGFQVFVNFMYSSMKTIKPYTPDISLTSDSGIDDSTYQKLSELDGVKRTYGRMFDHVDATFNVNRLTEAYQKEIGSLTVNDDNTFIPAEKSWLISYDKNQLKWAKTDLLKGTLSEDALNANNGVIATVFNIRNGVSEETADLKIDDKVTIETADGAKQYTVMAILRSVPFSDDQLNQTIFITTEKLYTEITGDSTFDIVDIQLNHGNQEETVASIKNIIGGNVKFMDARQKNAEASQAFLTMALFIYGFVFVIALISILNIVNTMQTSVSAKTRYLGVMRAVGMSGKQLNRMIVSEATTYSFAGSLAGIILGTFLQYVLITKLLPNAHMTFSFPWFQLLLIVGVVLLVTLLSVVGPLKRIKAKGISETIGSIQ